MAMPDDPVIQAANAAAQHAQTAGRRATDAENAAQRAEGAAVLATTAQAAEPSWVYAMVVGILGAALLTLIIAAVIAASNGETVDTAIVSVVSLIAGGLIGVLAPSPQKGKP